MHDNGEDGDHDGGILAEDEMHHHDEQQKQQNVFLACSAEEAHDGDATATHFMGTDRWICFPLGGGGGGSLDPYGTPMQLYEAEDLEPGTTVIFFVADRPLKSGGGGGGGVGGGVGSSSLCGDESNRDTTRSSDSYHSSHHHIQHQSHTQIYLWCGDESPMTADIKGIWQHSLAHNLNASVEIKKFILTHLSPPEGSPVSRLIKSHIFGLTPVTIVNQDDEEDDFIGLFC